MRSAGRAWRLGLVLPAAVAAVCAVGTDAQAPAGSKPPRWVLKGRVATVGGEPVAGARIGGPDSIGPISDDFEAHFPAQSDERGSFTFNVMRPDDDGRWPVLAIEMERGLAGIALMPKGALPEEPVTIAMAEGGYISGVVVDTEGQPMAGVDLTLSIHPGGQGLGFSMGAGKTDDQGAFRLGPLPVGPTYYVRPRGEFARLVASGGRQPMTVDPAIEGELEPIVLNPPGRTLRGVVLDANLSPVAGAVVGVSCGQDTVRTDGEGRFEVTRLPASGTLWVVAFHETEPLAGAERLDPGWGIEPGLILRELGSAKGRVLNQAGRPVAGAQLWMYPELPIEREDGGQHCLTMWQQELLRRLGGPPFVAPIADTDGNWRAVNLIRGAEYVADVKLADGTEARGRYQFTVAEEDETDAGDLTVTVPGR